MRGELMILPGETYLAEQMLVADPGAIHAEREGAQGLARQRRSRAELAALHDRAQRRCRTACDAAARGARKLKTQALVYLAAGDPDARRAMAAAQYDAADNMTDRQGALMVLCGLDSARARRTSCSISTTASRATRW